MTSSADRRTAPEVAGRVTSSAVAPRSSTAPLALLVSSGLLLAVGCVAESDSGPRSGLSTERPDFSKFDEAEPSSLGGSAVDDTDVASTDVAATDVGFTDVAATDVDATDAPPTQTDETTTDGVCPFETGAEPQCDTCVQERCCDELSACAEGSACLDYNDCLVDCSQTADVAACVAAQCDVDGQGAADQAAYFDCIDGQCGAECGQDATCPTAQSGSSDPACAECMESNCCAELTTCFVGSACVDYAQCVESCDSLECVAAQCDVYGQGAFDEAAFTGCQESYCLDECGLRSACTVSNPIPDDPLCGLCLEERCCSELSACVAGTACDQYVSCISDCADSADEASCLAANCPSGSPGHAEWASLQSCLVVDCETECRVEPTFCEVELQLDGPRCDACVELECCDALIACQVGSECNDALACVDACNAEADFNACFDANCSGFSDAALDELLTLAECASQETGPCAAECAAGN